MTQISFHYDFHAVGQGLFASGHLNQNWPPSEQKFNWVFDCGTSSKQAYLQRELARFQSDIRGMPIGLFCLSHFDEDHVNGARDLLSQQRVDTLVMPYFTFVERMQIASSTPDLTDDYFAFLVDPPGYMFTTAGDNLGEIIFILGGGEPPTEESQRIQQPSSPDQDGNTPWTFDPPNVEPYKPSAPEDLFGVTVNPSRMQDVRVFRHQEPFSVGSYWEFQFFNEHFPDTKTFYVRAQVAKLVARFRRANGSFEGANLVNRLKKFYPREFGTSSQAKNKISLVVYSGPVINATEPNGMLWGSIIPASTGRPFWSFPSLLLNPPSQSSGVLYFGDFPLNKPEKLDTLQRHFGPARWEKIGVVQVPHHGSIRSWFKGASASFRPNASVISSRRTSKNYPNEIVLDDLGIHGIVLVNERQRAKFEGRI